MKLMIGKYIAFAFVSVSIALEAKDAFNLKKSFLTTQTGAYLSIPELQTTVVKWLGNGPLSPHDKKSEFYEKYKGLKGSLKKYDKIIKSALTREEKYKNTHYVFYHSFNYRWRIIGDLQKALYELLTHKSVRGDFIFLRPCTFSFFNVPPVNQWLAEKLNQYGADYDNYKPGVQDLLLSTNLSLFGEIGRPRSFTFKFFVESNNGNPPVMGKILNQIISPFTSDPLQKAHYIAILVELLDTITTQEGNLIQIFIPKKLADQCVYASKERGKVWDEVIERSCFNASKKRHTAFAPLLERYRKQPKTIARYIDKLEARILLRGQLFLNPQSSVKMFRYSTLDKKRHDLYKKRIKIIAKHIYQQRPQTLSQYMLYK